MRSWFAERAKGVNQRMCSWLEWVKGVTHRMRSWQGRIEVVTVGSCSASSVSPPPHSLRPLRVSLVPHHWLLVILPVSVVCCCNTTVAA